MLEMGYNEVLDDLHAREMDMVIELSSSWASSGPSPNSPVPEHGIANVFYPPPALARGSVLTRRPSVHQMRRRLALRPLRLTDTGLHGARGEMSE